MPFVLPHITVFYRLQCVFREPSRPSHSDGHRTLSQRRQRSYEDIRRTTPVATYEQAPCDDYVPGYIRHGRRFDSRPVNGYEGSPHGGPASEPVRHGRHPHSRPAEVYAEDPGDGAVGPTRHSRHSHSRSHMRRHASHPPTNRELRHHVARMEAPEPAPEPQPIHFYERDKPYFEFTNFSPHAVQYRGRSYPTSEHLFQALKFIDQYPDLAERIRRQPTAKDALREATRLQRLRRPDWFDVNVKMMDSVLDAKFTQHPRLRKMLLETGDSPLLENSPVDSFWGVGQDGRGSNELGKALMRLRKELQRTPR